MNLTLSIYFASDKTYLTVLEPTKKGLSLVYVNSTFNPVNLEKEDELFSQPGVIELLNLFEELPENISQLTLTLPAENVAVTQFPGMTDMSIDDMKKLVELEIRQTLPQFNFDVFLATTIPLMPKLDEQKMILAIILSKQSFKSCNLIAEKLGLPVLNIEISQMNAHSAFLYNYPEHFDKAIALMGFQGKFVDISVIKEGKPYYYNLIGFTDIEFITHILQKEINKILSEYISTVDYAYLFGAGLTKEILSLAGNSLSGFVNETKKLNAFRMLTTTLSERERKYCSRTAHIYPPCIGGSMVSYHERFKLV
ncbi:MAG: hypothetical protein ABSG15_02995 [FCB group bacterium]|jgi:hypothetical protein